MNQRNHTSLLVLFALSLTVVVMAPSVCRAGKKEHFTETGKVVEMQDVPCGSRSKGLGGVGSIFASVGVTDVNAKEKLCQEYVLRTADTEYRIRPLNDKHPGLLPVGAESNFRIKKDRVLLSVPEGDGKVREYKVVAMKPLTGADNEAAAPAADAESREDSQPAVGAWTATLGKNSPAGSSDNPGSPVPGATNPSAADTATSDPTVADSPAQAPNPSTYQPASDPSAQYQLAMSLEEKGDINGAVAAFRKVVQAKPDDARAHAALAGALERRGDSAGALREYGLALKLDPNDPAVRANYDRLAQTTGGDASGSGS
jgi:tetratricopeptide (TPR) repeat protein